MSDTTDPILRTLTATHALLAEGPERWTRGANALDMLGNEVNPKSDQAVCFCFNGALARFVSNEIEWDNAYDFVRLLLGNNPVSLNDTIWEYADVLAVLARSIDARREEIGGVP